MSRPASSFAVHALAGIGEVGPGDQLAGVVLEATAASALALADGDVVVVTSKIVSKLQGRFVSLETVTPGAEALRLAELTLKDARLVELVLRESSDVVRAAPRVLITRHRLGLVMANAGIDQSNIGPGDAGRVLLLPEDLDGVAAGLRAELEQACGVRLAVVISDSFGRPWRQGTINVAIGSSGLPSLWDRRGEPDRDGRTLEATEVALADMIASAAGLATGESAEGLPIALVRGLAWSAPERPAAALMRPVHQDLFR